MPTQEQPTIDLSLAEALAARLCHDLAGLLGTLTGALELASEDATMHDEALPMALEAGIVLGQRLRLLRAAWGGDSCAMHGSDLTALAAGLPLGRRTQTRLDGLSPGRLFSAGASRLVLNLLLLAVESLGGNGTLELDETPDGNLVLTIKGPRAAWPPGLIGQFAELKLARAAAAECGPQDLMGPLSALTAHAAGLRVSPLFGPADTAPPLLIAIDGL